MNRIREGGVRDPEIADGIDGMATLLYGLAGQVGDTRIAERVRVLADTTAEVAALAR